MNGAKSPRPFVSSIIRAAVLKGNGIARGCGSSTGRLTAGGATAEPDVDNDALAFLKTASAIGVRSLRGHPLRKAFL